MSNNALIRAAKSLSGQVQKLKFAGAVAYVYNPLDYAWAIHEQYLSRFGKAPKSVLMLGMNPGPFGMMQTGVPFGEISAVRDWMALSGTVKQPKSFHPKRPIDGLACQRSEVSGRRLWGWAADQFGSADEFFRHTFVVNYCPLVFLEASGRNLTPDKLPAAEQVPLQAACDKHLQQVIEHLQPSWVIGVGAYAAKRLQTIVGGDIETGQTDKPGKTKRRTRQPTIAGPASQPLANGANRVSAAPAPVRVGQILHPSPASPLANRGWASAAQATLDALRVYPT